MFRVDHDEQKEINPIIWIFVLLFCVMYFTACSNKLIVKNCDITTQGDYWVCEKDMNKHEKDMVSFLISLFCVILFLFILLIFLGCAMNPVMDVKKSAQETYRKDLKVKVNGKEYLGIGV